MNPRTRPELEDLLQRAYRYALALAHDPDRAADLVQDACVALLAADGEWTRGYLFAAVRSRFIDQYRRGRLVVMESIDEAPAGWDASAVDEERLHVEIAALERGLGLLGREEREVLFLAAVEGYTAREIAAATERPRGTVTSLIYRARRKLLALLSEDETEALRKP